MLVLGESGPSRTERQDQRVRGEDEREREGREGGVRKEIVRGEGENEGEG